MIDQFYSSHNEDVTSHLNNFIELCDMTKIYKGGGWHCQTETFLFSLRAREKEWLLSLPKNSIDWWNKYKDYFIGKYYPPIKIIQLINLIMNFKQLEHDPIAQAWEIIKIITKNCHA